MATDIQIAGPDHGPDLEVDRSWFGQRAKRTEAMPKNSLFGADLEIFQDAEVENRRQLDIKQFQKDVEKQRLQKQRRYHTTLPDYLRKKGPEDITLDETKRTIEKQIKETERAKKMLDVLETNSKYFSVGIYDESARDNPSRDEKSHQWFKRSDLKHAKDINIIGLEKSHTLNYNRDRYDKKSDTHQYSLIGDPLRPGMDFSGEKSGNGNLRPRYTRAQDPSWLPKEAYMKKKEEDPFLSEVPVDLPPNIQHTFGSTICKSVLSDKDKIEETIKDQEMIKSNFYKTRRNHGKKFVLPSDVADPVYESLSQSVRQNMFPGFTFNHTKGLTKSVYTDDVFKNRLKDPDQWRCQRDELSSWQEQNVLYGRMMKAWQAYHQDQPKFDANWDRSAKRVVVQPPKDTPKKVKAKSVKQGKVKDGPKGSGFEDVVFVTPPLTPPPPPPEKIPQNKDVKKDDEFWNFYNKKM